MAAEFRVLGTVEAMNDGQQVNLGHRRQRGVLTVLLVKANHPVPVDEFMDHIWGERLPHRGREVLYSYLSRLRTILAKIPAVSLERRSTGYVLTVDEASIDLHRFRQLVEQARAAGGTDTALTLFDQALALWRGTAFTDLDSPWLAMVRTAVEAERRAAELDRTDTALHCGHHAELLADLTTQAAHHPLDERLARQVMLALYRTGRQADALAHYLRLREELAEQLGADANPSLQQLYHQILTSDPGLATPARPAAAPSQLPSPPAGTSGVDENGRDISRSRVAAASCGLPPEVPDLLGREDELARLRSEAMSGGAVVVVVGHPGVGKTALAVSAAHRLRPRFPDGCFAVDLRGMDDQPVTARTALDRLLRALGVPQSEMPASVTEQSNLFRILLADQRVLVLLDNAADEEQVRPLLVSAPGCLTLVTCRQTLAGLEAARWVWLEPLSDADAVELLARISPRRVATEPEVAAELVSLCGNLPLAVRIAGNRLATRPHWSLAYLAGQLRDERTRLSSLSVGDLQIRSAFEMSYRRLSSGASLVFRRLAALPGADFDAELAEVATGPMTDVHLDELADASLLQAMPVPGRFQFHDLIRIFAGERLAAEETPDERDRLAHAVLDHLVGTACAAARVFHPEVVETDGLTHEEAVEWLDREQSNWVAAQREAARLGRHQDVLDLAKAMHWYSDRRTQYPWDEIFGLGVDAARILGNRADEAKLLNFLGWAQVMCLGDNESGRDTHQQALVIATEVGDRPEQAWALGYLSSALTRLGRLEEALESARQACVLAGGFSFWILQLPLRTRLARVLQVSGRDEEALSVHRATLAEGEIHRDQTSAETHRWATAMVRLEIGRCLANLGRWETAAETFGQTRRTFAQSNLPYWEATAALHEGTAWRKAGEYARARVRLEQALLTFSDATAHPQRQQVLAELARLPDDRPTAPGGRSSAAGTGS